MLGHLFLDFVDRDPPLVRAQQVVQQLLRAFERDLASNQLHMRADAVQRAFELTYVRHDLVGEKLKHLWRHGDARMFGLRLQDAETQLVGGRVQIGDETPAQA